MASGERKPVHRRETLSDHVVTPGLILFTERFFTERFAECVAFYRDTLGLPVWFEKVGLCCLRLGAGYLMVKTGGTAKAAHKTVDETPTALRFNVKDVLAVASLLKTQGIDVTVTRYDWGIIGSYLARDGNACSRRNAAHSRLVYCAA